MTATKKLFKSVVFTTLLSTGFAAASIAQNTTTIVSNTPIVEATTPNSGQTNVELNTAIEVTFNTEMDETTINRSTLLLHESSKGSMYNREGEEMNDHSMDRSIQNNRNITNESLRGTISYSDRVAVFTPDEELKEGTTYTFTVSNSATSTDYVALDNDYTWSFTTTGTSDTTYADNQNVSYGLDRNQRDQRQMDAMHEGSSNMIELGLAGDFVILAKENVKNGSGSNITGQVGEGSVSEKLKKEKEYTEQARERISGNVLVLESNKRDTTTTDVNEAILDMMSAFSFVSMQNDNNDNNVMRHNNNINNDNRFQNNMLSPGDHEWNDSLHLDSNVTISGSADDIWLIKVSGDLVIDDNITITLSDGAQADNVFWFVEGDVTIGKDAHFEGIILSMNDITLEEGARFNGRMYSQSSINLNDNTVSEPMSMTGRASSINRQERD